jgi:hypothetical protein
MTIARLFRFKVLQPDSTSGAQAAASLFNATQEARIMLEAIYDCIHCLATASERGPYSPSALRQSRGARLRAANAVGKLCHN